MLSTWLWVLVADAECSRACVDRTLRHHCCLKRIFACWLQRSECEQRVLRLQALFQDEQAADESRHGAHRLENPVMHEHRSVSTARMPLTSQGMGPFTHELDLTSNCSLPDFHPPPPTIRLRYRTAHVVQINETARTPSTLGCSSKDNKMPNVTSPSDSKKYCVQSELLFGALLPQSKAAQKGPEARFLLLRLA